MYSYVPQVWSLATAVELIRYLLNNIKMVNVMAINLGFVDHKIVLIIL